MTNIVGALARDFFNPFINATANVDAEESQYGSPYSWGAVILTASAALYLAHSCLKGRNITPFAPGHKTYLDHPERLSELQRAVDGSSEVYSGSNFVIKGCVSTSRNSTFASRKKVIHFVSDPRRHKYLRLIVPAYLGNDRNKIYMAEQLVWNDKDLMNHKIQSKHCMKDVCT